MKDSAFTTVKRDSKEYHLSMKGVYERGTFSVENGVYGKGLDLGADFPRITVC